MKILFTRAIPLIIGILLSCAQACKSSRPRGWYLKVRKADYEAKLKELKEAKERERELSRQLLEQREQNQESSVIEQEENVLRMIKCSLMAQDTDTYQPLRGMLPLGQDNRSTFQ